MLNHHFAGIKNIAFFLAIAILFASGCKSNKGNKDDAGSVMSKKEMVAFLTDLQLAEANIRAITDPRSTDSLQRQLYFYDLYEKHGITPSDFNASLNYYLAHVEELDDVYDEVIARLMKEQEELRNRKSGGKKIPANVNSEKEE